MQFGTGNKRPVICMSVLWRGEGTVLPPCVCGGCKDAIIVLVACVRRPHPLRLLTSAEGDEQQAVRPCQPDHHRWPTHRRRQ